MTKATTPEPFVPSAYWERRLSQDFSLTGVGLRRLGRSFNQWAYRVRRERFHDTVSSLSLDLPSCKVLDVGSGTGTYLDCWRQLGAGQITGSDLAQAAVTKLGDRYPELLIHHLDIGAPLGRHWQESSFDVVSAMDVLFHIIDDRGFRDALANIHRLLATGGFLIWTDGFVHHDTHRRPHIHARGLRQIELILHSVGFDVLSRRPLLWLMNTPIDTRNRLAKPAWLAAAGLVSLSDHVGAAIGRAIYPLERHLTRTRAESPTMEIMVCVKRLRVT